MQQAADKGSVEAKYWLEKKIFIDHSVIDEKIKNSTHYHVVKNFPRVNQVGPYCGYAAFAGACEFAQQLTVYPTAHEKRMAGKIIEESNQDILVEIKNSYPTVQGEQYDIRAFEDLANHYQIKNCKAVILDENCTKEKYRETLCEAIEANHVLIVPCDNVDMMPAANNGKSTHWVLVTGFYRDELTKDYKFIYTHHDVNCDASVDGIEKEVGFFGSNKQLPKDNPLREGGSLEKYKNTFFKMPVKAPREVLCKKPGCNN